MQRSFTSVLAIMLAALQIAAGPAPGPDASFDSARAMRDIAALLQFTPRSLGAPGHEQAIAYIESQMAKTPAKTMSLQRWTYYPNDTTEIALTNIIARTEPANPRRVIVATHYDSIVRAYRDKRAPNGPMPGANNSASGVAVLLESARALGGPPSLPFGIDFIFFDGEEGPKSLGAGDPDWQALGSPHFARHLAEVYPDGKPEKAVVFDMVCDSDLLLQPEEIFADLCPCRDCEVLGCGNQDCAVEICPHAAARGDRRRSHGACASRHPELSGDRFRLCLVQYHARHDRQVFAREPRCGRTHAPALSLRVIDQETRIYCAIGAGGSSWTGTVKSRSPAVSKLSVSAMLVPLRKGATSPMSMM